MKKETPKEKKSIHYDFLAQRTLADAIVLTLFGPDLEREEYRFAVYTQ